MCVLYSEFREENHKSELVGNTSSVSLITPTGFRRTVFEGEWLWRLTPIAAGHAAKSIPSFTRRSADSRRKSRQIEAEGPRLA